MKVFRFDQEIGQKMGVYDSNFILSRIVMTERPARVGCMYLERGGLIGFHQAAVPQLFLVVQGKGWVRGEENEKRRITQGEAAFWDAGEGHETTTDTGLTAIVIESEVLDPAKFLTEIKK